MPMQVIYRLILGFVTIGSLTSCTTWYQLYEVDSPDIILYENDYFVDTSSRVHVIYDFWSEGGIPIIELANAYSDTVLVDFKKSFFVIGRDSFSFATKYQPDSVGNYDNDAGYNILFDAMPGSVLLAPGASFKFEGTLWNFEWSGDVSNKEPTRRYPYSGSPLKLTNAFVYAWPDPAGTESRQVRADTIFHRMYLSRITQLDDAAYKARVQSDVLSNKFYIKPESGWPEEARFDIASTLLALFRGGN